MKATKSTISNPYGLKLKKAKTKDEVLFLADSLYFALNIYAIKNKQISLNNLLKLNIKNYWQVISHFVLDKNGISLKHMDFENSPNAVNIVIEAFNIFSSYLEELNFDPLISKEKPLTKDDLANLFNLFKDK